MIIKMRLNHSERARLIALAQHYNLPVSHAGFGMALHNAILELSDQPARWGREDAPPAAPDTPPDYLTVVLNDVAQDALGDIARRAGTSGAPLKETLLFCVNTVLFNSTTDIGALQRAARQRHEPARILAQLETNPDAEAYYERADYEHARLTDR